MKPLEPFYNTPSQTPTFFLFFFSFLTFFWNKQLRLDLAAVDRTKSLSATRPGINGKA